MTQEQVPVAQTNAAKTLIQVDNVWERFRLRHDRSRTLRHTLTQIGKKSTYEDFWALKGLSLDIYQGDSIALIGPNGSGKTTLLKCIAGVLPPTRGRIDIDGRVSALLELGAGFHPDLTGRENIYLNGAIIGMKQREIARLFDEIVAFAELEHFLDSPLRTYSSGMQVRLGFSIAVHLDFDILLIDEVLAVGDMAFQAKCLRKIEEFLERGKTIVYVSHQLDTVRRVCKRAAWLDLGELKTVGATEEVIEQYLEDVRREEEHKLKTMGQIFRGEGEGEAAGPVKIHSVSLKDSGGVERAIFRTGEELTVEVIYEAEGRIDNPEFGVSLWTAGGLLIAAEDSRYGGGAKPGFIEGQGTYRYVIPHLFLMPGTYMVSTSVFDRNGFRYDCRIWHTRFTVMEEATGNPLGIVKSTGRWKFNGA